MTHVGYIFAGYFSTAAILGVYALWVIRRKRTLARILSPTDTRSAESRQAARSAESRQAARSAESRQAAQ